jgi:hypothetical protein
VEINLPQEQEEEEQRRLRKTAEGPVFSAVSDYLNTPSNYSVINWLKGLKPTGDLLAMPSLSPGAPLSKPWFMPSVVGAATLGTLGGYKAVGAGLDTMEDQRRKNELEDAKREYRNALVEQYNADKRASDNPATLLDNVADKFIKQAGWGELVGAGTGAYLTLAGLLAGGAGYGTYNWVKDRLAGEQAGQGHQAAGTPSLGDAAPGDLRRHETRCCARTDDRAGGRRPGSAKDEDQAKARRAHRRCRSLVRLKWPWRPFTLEVVCHELLSILRQEHFRSWSRSMPNSVLPDEAGKREEPGQSP